MRQTDTNPRDDFAKVSTIHILKSGEMINSLQDYLKVEDRFAWVDRSYIISKMLRLITLTNTSKKSVIAIYEEGHQIKEFVNVEQEFKPLTFG